MYNRNGCMEHGKLLHRQIRRGRPCDSEACRLILHPVDRELLVMYIRAINLWEADGEGTEELKILLENSVSMSLTSSAFSVHALKMN